VPSTIRIKRSSVAGKRPTTSDISTGELAINTKDFKLFSSNGTAVFELGNAGALANTNARIGLLNTNLTGTNTALRTLIATKANDVGAANRIPYRNSSNVLTSSSGLQYDGVSIKVNGNLESTYQNGNEGGEIFLAKPLTNSTITNGVTIDVFQNQLRIFENGGSNRGAYIDLTAASGGVGSNLLTGGVGGTVTLVKATVKDLAQNDLVVTNATLAGVTSVVDNGIVQQTNTALRTLINNRLQVANAAAIYQTRAIERAALANTNASIATQATRITLVNTNLLATNTAIRALDNQKLSVANAVSTYATRSNPTTSGLLAHTGRATISTNLAVTGNTTVAGLIANGSLGISNRVLKTNGTTVFWGEAGATGTPVVLTRKNVSALLETDQVVTNVTATAYANTVVDNSLLANYAPRNSPTFTGTIDDSQAAIRNQILTDGATISWNTTLGTVATVTLGGNRTLSNPTGLRVGTYMLIVKQDGTGSRTLTWGTAYKFPAGAKPTLTTSANAIDVISFFCDGTNMFGSYAPNMS
jgi:hypothetical protein